MKKLLFSLFASLALCGCESLEEAPAPIPEIEILPRRVSHIRVTIPEDMTYTLRYTYDSRDRIVEIRETDRQHLYEGAPADQVSADAVTTVAYAEDRITVTGPNDTEILELTDGRATSRTTTPAAGSSFADRYTFTYDDRGYLRGSTFLFEEYDETSVYEYEIADGSLTGYTVYEEEGPEYAVYTNDPARPNNLNIDLFGIDVFADGDFETSCLFNVNGERFRTLPVRIVYRSDDDNDDEAYVYRYTTQSEYLSRIDIYDDDRGRQELNCTLEIFYEE